MQAIKAGILEIADILVVNKADLPTAEIVFKQLHIYTDLQRKPGWDVPILKTVAHKEEGIAEVLDAIEKHWAFLQESGRIEEVTRQRPCQLLATAESILLERVVKGADAKIGNCEQIAARELTRGPLRRG
jgi:LAO/AO transport system kinase